MRTQPDLALLLCATLLPLAACDRAATTPSDAEISAAEANALAIGFDGLGLVVLGGLDLFGGIDFNVSSSSASESRPIDVQFTRTHACPEGGSVAVAGHVRGTVDRAARSTSIRIDATKTQQDCAWETRRGVTVAVSGNPNIAVAASYKLENGRPSGLQTVTQKGAFTWTRGTGESGSCAVDLNSTLDPENGTYTLSGTLCDRKVDLVRRS